MIRLGDIPDQQLIEEIASGVRSHPTQEMTELEQTELVNAMIEGGNFAVINYEGKFFTNDPLIAQGYIMEYVMRKGKLLGL